MTPEASHQPQILPLYHFFCTTSIAAANEHGWPRLLLVLNLALCVGLSLFARLSDGEDQQSQAPRPDKATVLREQLQSGRLVPITPAAFQVDAECPPCSRPA